MYEPDKFLQLLQEISWSTDAPSDYSPEFSFFIAKSSPKELDSYMILLEQKCQSDYTLACKFVNYIFSHPPFENLGPLFDGAVIFAARRAAQNNQRPYAKQLLQKLVDFRYPNLNIKLPDITTTYDPMQFSKEPFLVANGAYSAVSASKPDRNNNNMVYALKYFLFVPNTTQYTFYDLEVIFRETIILKFLNLQNHPHIIPLYETYLSSPRMLMKMAFTHFGSLQQQLASNLHTINYYWLDLIKQLLDGLIYIHAQEIVHRDIKPANLVLFTDYFGKYVLKIIDFGGAKFKKDLSTHDRCVTTPYYASPESLSPQMLESDKSDVFSALMVLFMMIQNFWASHPFSDHPNTAMFLHINQYPGDSDYIFKSLHNPTLLPSFHKTVVNQNITDLMKKELLATPENRSSAAVLRAKFI